VKAGERAPEFTLPDDTGTNRSLTELLSAGSDHPLFLSGGFHARLHQPGLQAARSAFGYQRAGCGSSASAPNLRIAREISPKIPIAVTLLSDEGKDGDQDVRAQRAARDRRSARQLPGGRGSHACATRCSLISELAGTWTSCEKPSRCAPRARCRASISGARRRPGRLSAPSRHTQWRSPTARPVGCRPCRQVGHDGGQRVGMPDDQDRLPRMVAQHAARKPAGIILVDTTGVMPSICARGRLWRGCEAFPTHKCRDHRLSDGYRRAAVPVTRARFALRTQRGSSP